MKREIQRETYRFIGGSDVAKQIEKRQVVGTYTQKSIVRTLAYNQKYVISGKKLKTSINNPRQAYLLYYGKNKEDIDQIIKIVVDKEALEKGDPNALAVDGICKGAINVKVRTVALKTLCVATFALAVGVATYAFVKGIEKEAKLQEEQNSSYVDDLNEQRRENGLDELGFEIYDVEEATHSRSR